MNLDRQVARFLAPVQEMFAHACVQAGVSGSAVHGSGSWQVQGTGQQHQQREPDRLVCFSKAVSQYCTVLHVGLHGVHRG